MLSPLRNPVYRNLFFAQVIALTGTGLATVALTLLAHDLAGGNAGVVLGTALAIKMVAYIVVAPVVGGIAHRLPRKFVLVSLDVARALLVALLPWIEEIWQVYLLIFLLNACAAGFTPLYQATIPDVLVDESLYTRALSLSRLTRDLELLASPMIAAFLLVFASYHVLFVVNAVAFVFSGLMIISTGFPAPPASDRGPGIFANLTYGLHVYLATPRLRGVLLASAAAAFAGAMIIVNTVVFIREILSRTEADTAVALAAAGGGSMFAALVLPRLLTWISPRAVMLMGAVVCAPPLALSALSPSFGSICALWFTIGMGSSLAQTPVGRILAASCRESDRSAIFSAHFALSHACWLAAYPLAGWVGGHNGLAASAIVLAACATITGIGAALAWPAQDSVELEHQHEAIAHEHHHVHDEHHQHDHDGDEAMAPHTHHHVHERISHRHAFVIDLHHPRWPG
jgi:MFS family permease